MQHPTDERSLGELFADLARETGTLVSREVALARTEMTEKAAQVGKDVAFLAVGGMIAYAGLLAIIAAVILVLGANGVPLWVSALIIGLVVAVVGYGLIQRGLAALKRLDFAPRQTLETLKEDTRWAKEQIQ
jgi:hypothetical protein